MHPTLTLDDSMLMSSGDNRKCYIHPDNPNLCIKILHEGLPWKIQRREIAYYRALQRRNISWEMLGRFDSVVNTNVGKGLVFELIRDHDGEISKTLHHYLELNQPEMNDIVVREVEKLKAYLYDNGIVFRDLITLNILLRKDSASGYQAMIIDGIGHNDFIPIVNISMKQSRRKITRMWGRKRDKWFNPYPSVIERITDYPHHTGS